jgi:hypothetical protein
MMFSAIFRGSQKALHLVMRSQRRFENVSHSQNCSGIPSAGDFMSDRRSQQLLSGGAQPKNQEFRIQQEQLTPYGQESQTH